MLETEDQAYSYTASAFALSRKVVGTNAHCVIAADGVAKSIVIIPSINGESQTAKVYPVKHAHIYPNYYKTGDVSDDFAILVLEDELPYEVGRFALLPNAFHDLGKQELLCNINSYPGDKNLYEMWYEKRLVQQGYSYLVSKNYSYGGQSGAPISLAEYSTDLPPLIAINQGGSSRKEVQVSSNMAELDWEKVGFIQNVLEEDLLKDIIVY